MNENNNTRNRIKEIFINLFFLQPDQIHDKLSGDDIPGWDSMQHLNLVLSLEQEFGIAITPEESTEMLNFGLVVMIVEEKCSEKP